MRLRIYPSVLKKARNLAARKKSAWAAPGVYLLNALETSIKYALSDPANCVEVLTRRSVDSRLCTFQAPWGEQLWALLVPLGHRGPLHWGITWDVADIMNEATKNRGKWILRGVL